MLSNSFLQYIVVIVKIWLLFDSQITHSLHWPSIYLAFSRQKKCNPISKPCVLKRMWWGSPKLRLSNSPDFEAIYILGSGVADLPSKYSSTISIVQLGFFLMQRKLFPQYMESRRSCFTFDGGNCILRIIGMLKTSEQKEIDMGSTPKFAMETSLLISCIKYTTSGITHNFWKVNLLKPNNEYPLILHWRWFLPQSLCSSNAAIAATTSDTTEFHHVGDFRRCSCKLFKHIMRSAQSAASQSVIHRWRKYSFYP